MNSEPTTPEARTNPFADPAKAFDALMATGQALRKHALIVVKDQPDDTGNQINRAKWHSAATNAIKLGVFDKEKTRKLKALRDELRRTKVKA